MDTTDESVPRVQMMAQYEPKSGQYYTKPEPIPQTRSGQEKVGSMANNYRMDDGDKCSKDNYAKSIGSQRGKGKKNFARRNLGQNEPEPIRQPELETQACSNIPKQETIKTRLETNASLHENAQPQGDWRASIWPFVILLGSILLSIGNTILLSFLFQSIQTSNEISNFDGKISWHEESSSNILETATSLGEFDRLRLNSLEKVTQLPLELMVQFEQTDDANEMRIKFIEQINNKNDKLNFDNDTMNSYFALNLKATHDELLSSEDNLRKTLELGTRMLYLNKINKQHQRHSKLAPAGQRDNDKRGESGPSISRLLELDTQEASVTLPLQTHLKNAFDNDDQSISNAQIHRNQDAIEIQEQLVCPHLHGSLESDLELQARNGNLNCEATNGDLRAESKSADAKLSFYGDINMEATEIELDAQDVFIPKGLRYFDSVPPISRQQIPITINGDQLLSPNGEQDDSRARELISLGDQLFVAEDP